MLNERFYKLLIAIKLSRPRTVVPGFMAYVYGANLAGAAFDYKFLLGAAASVAISACANLSNTYTDLVEDGYNVPYRRELIEDLGGLKDLWLVNLIGCLFIVITGFFINWHYLIAAILAALGLNLYSFKIKINRSQSLIKNLAIIIYYYATFAVAISVTVFFFMERNYPIFIFGLVASLILIGDSRFKARPIKSMVTFSLGLFLPFALGWTVGKSLFALPSQAIFFTVWFALYGVAKNIPDYHGDKLAGLKTSATVFQSKRRAAIFNFWSLLATYPLLTFLIYHGEIGWELIYLWTLFPVSTTIYLAMIAVDDVRKLNFLLKCAMAYAGIYMSLAVLLLRPGTLNIIMVAIGVALILFSDLLKVDSRIYRKGEPVGVTK